MAPPAGHIRPARYLLLFLVIMVGLYALVFFTGDRKPEPKLGIDLSGGTRVTLTARTPDNRPPSDAALNQAREIIDDRVNGLGVAGTEVVLDGNNIVITVPGDEGQEAKTLGQTAKLSFRKVLNGAGAGQTGAPGGLPGGAGQLPGQPPGGVPPGGAPPGGQLPGQPGGIAPGGGQQPGQQPPGQQPGQQPGGQQDQAPQDQAPQGSPAPALGATEPAAASAPTPPGGGNGDGGNGDGGQGADQQDGQNGDQPAGQSADQTPAEQIQQARATRQSEDPQVQAKALQDLRCGPNVQDPLAGNDDLHKPLIACGQDGNKYLLAPVSPQNDANCQRNPDYATFTCLTGEDIAGASSGQSQTGPGFEVNLDFRAAGAGKWAEFTAQNVGQQAAFVLDGEVVSAPRINQAINGGATNISGDFKQAEAQDLAEILRYGSLPLSFVSSDAQTVSATLGIASLEGGLLAGGIGLGLVVLFCLAYYRVLGVLLVASLALSGVLVFAVLVLLGRAVGFSLDLAGVAGFIIAIGFTADSFVIFFERLKDEMREGRSFRSAVPRAWVRARRTILAADAVSFLAAVVLYTVAAGDVQGFAFTLGMSTVLDLFVVFLVTHPALVYASRSKVLSKPSLSGLGSVQRAYPARRTPAAAKGAS